MSRFLNQEQKLEWGRHMREARKRKQLEREGKLPPEPIIPIPENPSEIPPEPPVENPPEPISEPPIETPPSSDSISEPNPDSTSNPNSTPIPEVKTPEPVIISSAEIKIHMPNEDTRSQLSEFVRDIIDTFFPGKYFDLKVKDRPQDRKYEIQIIFSDKDIRSFVVDKGNAQMEISNWCQRIKDNLEGKVSTGAFGIAPRKFIPKEIGKETEFFFRT